MSDDRITTIRKQVEHIARGCRGNQSHEPAPYVLTIEYALASLAADLAAAEARATEAEQERDDLLARGSVPRHPADDNEGSDAYWLRQKLRAALLHLRDIEDEYRVRGGEDGSFNMVRADRARSLHEQISEDFLNGKMTVPTMKEQRDAAVARANTLAKALAPFAEIPVFDEGCPVISVRVARANIVAARAALGEARGD